MAQGWRNGRWGEMPVTPWVQEQVTRHPSGEWRPLPPAEEYSTAKAVVIMLAVLAVVLAAVGGGIYLLVSTL